MGTGYLIIHISATGIEKADAGAYLQAIVLAALDKAFGIGCQVKARQGLAWPRNLSRRDRMGPSTGSSLRRMRLPVAVVSRSKGRRTP